MPVELFFAKQLHPLVGRHVLKLPVADNLKVSYFPSLRDIIIRKAGKKPPSWIFLPAFLYVNPIFFLRVHTHRNSSLSFVFSKRSFTKSIASIGFISDRYLRRIHIRSRRSLVEATSRRDSTSKPRCLRPGRYACCSGCDPAATPCYLFP